MVMLEDKHSAMQDCSWLRRGWLFHANWTVAKVEAHAGSRIVATTTGRWRESSLVSNKRTIWSGQWDAVVRGHSNVPRIHCALGPSGDLVVQRIVYNDTC